MPGSVIKYAPLLDGYMFVNCKAIMSGKNDENNLKKTMNENVELAAPDPFFRSATPNWRAAVMYSNLPAAANSVKYIFCVIS